ncbi:unnamed protein product, partial [Prorocentrum cordatum]
PHAPREARRGVSTGRPPSARGLAWPRRTKGAAAARGGPAGGSAPREGVGAPQVGDVVEGAVSWNNRNGRVEVELFRGAGSPQQWTAVVKGSKEDLSLLRFNEHLRGLEVESVDAQKLKVVASMPGLSELVGGRSYIRLEDLKEGDYIDGVVKLVLPNGGAIIDVGAKVDALLVGSTNVTKLLYRCDELHNMSVLEVFPESQKLYVFLKEPAGAVAARAITSKEVKIGSVIRRGRVIDRQPIGVWVDIHAERWAFLDEPPELAFRLDYREDQR